MARLLASPAPYLAALGIGLWLFSYWLAVDELRLPRFEKLPGLTQTLSDLFALHPQQGVSVFTEVYWQHIS